MKQMSVRIREIKGNKYLYYTYYNDGKKQEVYCGLASSVEAKRKALEIELEQLKKQRKKLVEKIAETESKLDKIM
jgi:seryl-tRNA synthetase